ncbi:MAG TPA: AAA family ATPase [Polyangia bacterium]|nr:AAA family ATPase [Polyangia bacterium]
MSDDDVPPIVRDLLQPRALGLTEGARTELRVTHASWVILTDSDVWKIKRPVDLGFLDYRTTESRHRFCDEEVRLNRRLAPDVYLGVDPIHATAGGHALKDDGPVVDWAVHMRRLPDQRSAQALVAQNALDAPMLERLAEHLAEFFGRAESVPEYGALAVLRKNVEENFVQVAPFVDDLLEQVALDGVKAFQLDQLARASDRFAERVASGRIRDGHGDLRLEHVYFLERPGQPPPSPVIIDCIEFTPRFRCGDVAGEIAFLAMELEAVRRPDLAAGLVARFAEATGDFGIYRVLDFYLSYRAWVRGKVAAFVAADATASTEIRRRKREEARRDMALARSFAGQRLDRPFLIVVGGMIGSGKSTLAAALGRALATPVVSSDRTRKARAGVTPTARADARLYALEERERIYATLIRTAADVLQSGRGIILDATFAERRWRWQAAAAAHAAQATFVFIETVAQDMETLRQRLTERRQGPSLSDATDEQLAHFVSEYESPSELDPAPRFEVATSATPARALAEALTHLDRLGIERASKRCRS